MKFKLLFLFIIAFNLPFFSKEEVLIDFNNLSDTKIDVSEFAGGSYSQQEKDAMSIDLAAPNWNIKINSSSLNVISRNKTLVMPINESLAYPKQTVLGIRAFFPDLQANDLC